MRNIGRRRKNATRVCTSELKRELPFSWGVLMFVLPKETMLPTFPYVRKALDNIGKVNEIEITPALKIYSIVTTSQLDSAQFQQQTDVAPIHLLY